MENENKNWIKKHPIWSGIIGFVVLLLLISLFVPDSDTSNSNIEEEPFDAISRVKSQIPSDMKTKVWYSEYEWTQEQITDTIWKVSASEGSAIWKVSTQNNLCSETGEYVNICSDNGYAQTYSNLGYCKLDYICE